MLLSERDVSPRSLQDACVSDSLRLTLQIMRGGESHGKE